MNMNMNDLISLAPVGGALVIAAALIGALIGILTSRHSRRFDRLLAASDEMRKVLESMQVDVAHMKEELQQRSAAPELAPPTFAPAPLLTADQRAGALEMLRCGAEVADVAAGIGIPHAEAELLQRVQRFLGAAPSLN
jgi:hypothetical protein